ncbi:MAG: transposase [Deltaproteobacteria bacterium]|nr:transposase [Deltaproteobacteria bacterium]
MRYRRVRIPGGTHFFSLVTYKRIPLFSNARNIETLVSAFSSVMKKHPFVMEACVILPVHLHCIWTLPKGDADFPMRWRLIKSRFSRHIEQGIGQNTPSRLRKKEKPVWQRRYWEHAIRDESDFVRHVEYIHYNPVKHGLVPIPKDWTYSSFHSFVRKGLCDTNWGAGVQPKLSPSTGCE